MPFEVHTNRERGHVDHGWLKASHSFSFARFVNEKRMNFGALLVLNEDRIAPGMGFGEHFHDNMEIVTIPLSGALLHEDNLGNKEIIRAGDIQIMSAGTGILHSEKNASQTDEVHLLQIWIAPNRASLPTRYEQITPDPDRLKNTFATVVAPQPQPDSLIIHQKATFKLGRFEIGKTFQTPATSLERGLYVFIINGKIHINDLDLASGDALAVWNETELEGNALEPTAMLLIEVPLTRPAKSA